MTSPLLILFFAAGVSSVFSRHVNFYRKDYTYVDEFDAYYKFHWDQNGRNWSSTFLTCDDEGAELFYPKIPDEWTVVKKLVRLLPSMPSNVTDIFVGIHDKFGIGEFLTIDGKPSPAPVLNLEGDGRCVILDTETGSLLASECYTGRDIPRPFVCKKVVDAGCPTVDKGYKYVKETRKCYKLNNKKMHWSRTMETCIMEGGILLVIESEMEAKIIYDEIIQKTDMIYAGFKIIFPDKEYYSVKGHKLSDTGFNNWYNGDRYECGIIRNYEGLSLGSLDCDNELPFVCEININN